MYTIFVNNYPINKAAALFAFAAAPSTGAVIARVTDTANPLLHKGTAPTTGTPILRRTGNPAGRRVPVKAPDRCPLCNSQKIGLLEGWQRRDLFPHYTPLQGLHWYLL